MGNALTVKINATIKKTSLQEIKKLSELESRSFSSMVDVLLVEAIKNRKGKAK